MNGRICKLDSGVAMVGLFATIAASPPFAPMSELEIPADNRQRLECHDLSRVVDVTFWPVADIVLILIWQQPEQIVDVNGEQVSKNTELASVKWAEAFSFGP